jgi:putative endonuclease
MGAAQRTGRSGESAAERFLVRRGWTVVVRNWRGGGGEIDLVVHRRGVLAICEVKTRADAAALHEVLTAAQRERIARAGAAFLSRRNEFSRHTVRFDLLTVTRHGFWWRVRHLPGAFEPRRESHRGSGQASRPYADERKDIR